MKKSYRIWIKYNDIGSIHKILKQPNISKIIDIGFSGHNTLAFDTKSMLPLELIKNFLKRQSNDGKLKGDCSIDLTIQQNITFKNEIINEPIKQKLK
jgi:hypothetical protein